MRRYEKLTTPTKTILAPSPKDLVDILLSNFNLCFGSVMYRTKYLEKDFKSFAEKYNKWGDRPYLIDLAKKGPILIITKKLVNYRIHENQDSQLHSADRSKELLSLFSLYKHTFLDENISSEDTRKFYKFSTNFVLLSGLSFATNFSEYQNFIKKAKQIGVFKPNYINFRGIWYILKAIKKFSW